MSFVCLRASDHCYCRGAIDGRCCRCGAAKPREHAALDEFGRMVIHQATDAMLNTLPKLTGMVYQVWKERK